MFLAREPWRSLWSTFRYATREIIRNLYIVVTSSFHHPPHHPPHTRTHTRAHTSSCCPRARTRSTTWNNATRRFRCSGCWTAWRGPGCRKSCSATGTRTSTLSGRSIFSLPRACATAVSTRAGLPFSTGTRCRWTIFRRAKPWHRFGTSGRPCIRRSIRLPRHRRHPPQVQASRHRRRRMVQPCAGGDRRHGWRDTPFRTALGPPIRADQACVFILRCVAGYRSARGKGCVCACCSCS